jgi:hypothetical protein
MQIIRNSATDSFKSLNHVQVDVLRLLPFIESTEYSIPPNIISKQVSPQISMSIYNIPNGQDDLKYAMRHLAQLYYNVNVLHINNIPMKVTSKRRITSNYLFVMYIYSLRNKLSQRVQLRYIIKQMDII